MTERRFLVWLVVGLAILAGVAYLVAVPTRTYLTQQTATHAAEVDLTRLTTEIDELEDRIAGLRDDDEIERLAREEYNFVYPDEEAYALLPAPPSPVAIPSGWPFDALRARLLD